MTDDPMKIFQELMANRDEKGERILHKILLKAVTRLTEKLHNGIIETWGDFAKEGALKFSVEDVIDFKDEAAKLRRLVEEHMHEPLKTALQPEVLEKLLRGLMDTSRAHIMNHYGDIIKIAVDGIKRCCVEFDEKLVEKIRCSVKFDNKERSDGEATIVIPEDEKIH